MKKIIVGVTFVVVYCVLTMVPATMGCHVKQNLTIQPPTLLSNWEHIDSGTDFVVETYRMKVHGGWIVRTMNHFGAHAGAMVFVPDEHHTWEIVK